MCPLKGVQIQTGVGSEWLKSQALALNVSKEDMTMGAGTRAADAMASRFEAEVDEHEERLKLKRRKSRKGSNLPYALLDLVRTDGVAVFVGPFKSCTTIQSTLLRYNKSRHTDLRLKQEQYTAVAGDGCELFKFWRIWKAEEANCQESLDSSVVKESFTTKEMKGEVE